MPLTEKEVLEGEFEVIRPPGIRKLYLIPGKTLGMQVPQTMVALDENELEEHKKFYNLIIEIGTANTDLAPGIEWEVWGIRRADIVNLLGNLLMRKRGENETNQEL